MRLAIPPVLILLFGSGPLQAAEPLPAAVIADVEVQIRQTLKNKHIPGLSVAIATGNQLRYEGAFGLADVEHRVPVRTTTRFRTASIAKPMTSTVILRLAEQGHLTLDEPVQTYCSDYPEKRWPVTPRLLLGHLGGIRHYTSSDEASSTRHFSSLTHALSVFRDDPLIHEPGTRFQYTSFGYNLLGSVAEGAGNTDFLTLLQELVLTPSRMQHTQVDNHFAVIPDRARGYIRFTESSLPGKFRALAMQPDTLYRSTLHDTSMKIPGGGLVSTSADLVRFATALNRGDLLNAASLEEAWTPQQTASGKLTGYGFGWGIGSLKGQTTISHGGAQSGTATSLLLIPEHGIAVALMCNLQGTSLKALSLSLAGIVAAPLQRPATDYSQVVSQLQNVIRREVKQKQLPAFSITLVDNQLRIWSGGFGTARTSPAQQATSETVYRVGSISKLFTDISVMQLVEQGRLDLDADIRDVLPDFQPHNPFDTAVTLRQLMSHRSGLVREGPVGSYFDPDEPSIAETVNSLNDTTLVYQPGTRTKYSNSAITVVGHVVEKISGLPFAEYVRKHLLQPLGMLNSDFDRTTHIERKLAQAEMWTVDGQRFPAPVFDFGIFPAGNLYSTTDDLAQFVQVLFRGGQLTDGRLLESETLANMMRPQEKGRFGIGFAISDFHGHRAIGHGGAVYGYSTQLTALIDAQLGVVAVASLDGANGTVSRISNYALELMLAARSGKSLPEYRTTEPIPKELARSAAGTYRNGDTHLVLTERAGRLFLRDGFYRHELRALADSLVVDDTLSFGLPVKVKNRDELTIHGQAWQRTEQEKPAASPHRWLGLIGEYGWDHNTLYIFEDRGQLHALIEWFYYYPLTETGQNTFAFPDEGLYHGEELIFQRDENGTATKVVAADVTFDRRVAGPAAGETFKIEPVRPVSELRAVALAAEPPYEPGSSFLDSELVDVATLDDSIRLDIRYATKNNFMGAIFYGQPRAFLQKPAALALVRVHRRLKERGYGVLIHDAYRPWYVTKMFWDATPQKLRNFVANPQKGSRHNRGCAVDLTLFHLDTGRPVQMVAGYDEFSPRAFPGYPGGTALQRWQRELLREEMQREGFEVYAYEWWHFDYRDWKVYRIGTQTFEDIDARND